MSNEKVKSNIMSMRIPWSVFGVLLPAAAFLCLLLGFLGRYAWFFELFSNFRAQYAIVAFIGALSLSFRKKDRKLAIFAYFIVLLISLTVLPIYLAPSAKFPKNASHHLRLMQINVLSANGEYEKVEKAIEEYDPDILLLDEVTSQWLDGLEGIREKYPYSLEEPRNDNFGIAIFAKNRPARCELRMSKTAQVPYIYARFMLDEKSGKSLAFWGVHTLPPIGRNYFDLRNAELAELAAEIRADSSSSKILAGDLNLTPWSYFFAKLEDESGLRNSQKGFGIQSSWPNKLIFLRIPIDHCLVSPAIKVLNRRIGHDVGSDHFPLILDLEI